MDSRFQALCAALVLAGCGRSHAAQKTQGQMTTSARDTSYAGAIDSAVVTRAEIALGDSVFNGPPRGGMCAPCHGPRGTGTRVAPNLNDKQWINGPGTLGFVEGTILQGVPHPQRHPFPMPPFTGALSDRQLHAVAAYVYSLSPPQRARADHRGSGLRARAHQ